MNVPLEDISSGFLGLMDLTPYILAIFSVLAATFVLFYIVSFALAIFLTNPAEVCFAKTNYDSIVNRNSDIGNFLFSFKNNYLNVVKVMFSRTWRLILWSLLPIAGIATMVSMMIYLHHAKLDAIALTLAVAAIPITVLLGIPSIVTRYRYMMVPYIVAENPDITPKEALLRSDTLMNGVKLETFVLRLSFIGWFILGSLCCGVGILFVSPYYYATETLLYYELKLKRFPGPSDGSTAVDTEIVW